jgi:peptide-methionine (S)-S-oxide reductase
MKNRCTTGKSLLTRITFFIAALGWTLGVVPLAAAEAPMKLPPPATDVASSDAGLQTAVIAGGCFWGIQAVYQHTDGVVQAISGYSGGSKKNAVYELVSKGRTGHAEAVEIKFDPKKISYGKILQIFFSVAHDPTELDRQGPDVGPQYRSAIFFVDDEQKRVAEAYVAQLNQAKVFSAGIVTRIDRLNAFYRAEPFHQDYLVRNPGHPYIFVHDMPKLDALMQLMPEVYRSVPVTVAATVAPN